jgi:two-component system chemotaxis sensor kinase CheA
MNETKTPGEQKSKPQRRKAANSQAPKHNAPRVTPQALAALDSGVMVAEIRQKVDEFATQALISQGGQDSTTSLLSALSDIAARAETAGLTQVPDVIWAMQQTLETHPEQEDALLSGISRLQKVIEDIGQAPPEASSAAEAAAAPIPISADPELLADFFMESRDHLVSIESQLLVIENNPANTDAIHNIFRSFHTIKGLAGFLELPAILAVAHEVETLLDLARNGELSITPLVVDVVLESADYLKTDIARIERAMNGETPSAPAENQALLVRIQAQMHGAGADEAGPVASLAEDGVAPKESADSDAKPAEQRKSANAESRLVKVDTSKLDFLVDMVGELVIAQSMVRHDGSLNSSSNPKLQRNLSQLARITGEVQKTAMGMRMVPIGHVFQRSVRLVRDLTRKSGKKAELELVGEDTELDRTIVEDLTDPLMHMIRNAADHGMETPEERVLTGKDPVGKIRLKAFHQAGHIVIEVSDDGRGMDREKLLNKARQRGLLTDGSALSDKEVFNLIFEPGFSTAEKVTDISGRGVGMDVVRKQIQKMRGRVDINSRLGQGTTFYLKLPLTLAIIDGLVVGVGQHRYIVPIYVVQEMFRPAPETVFTVENRHEMVLVRGQLLPVTRLHERFGVEPRSRDITQSLVVVAESGSKRICLMVDDLIGKQEVVIKSLGVTFKDIGGVAGGAILGDGRVALILEMDTLLGETASA